MKIGSQVAKAGCPLAMYLTILPLCSGEGYKGYGAEMLQHGLQHERKINLS
jgi:hypothetical protein